MTQLDLGVDVMRLRHLSGVAASVMILTSALALSTSVVGTKAFAAPTPLPIEIVGSDTSQAPLVVLSVSVPESITLNQDSKFRVLESGTPRTATVVNVPSDPMQIALTIDTSGSMAGSGLAGAKSAAIQLVDRLPADAAVEVIGFGNVPYVASGFTTNRAATKTAIESLVASGETSLNDAVILASRSFTKSRRTIVLLSDGQDTVSKANTEQAVRITSESGALVYGVVLSTADSDIAAPSAFAAASGGRVVNSGAPTELASIFSTIGTQLSSQFRISFISTGAGSTRLVVQARDDKEVLGSGETRLALPLSPSEEGARLALPEPTTPDGSVADDSGGFLNSNAAIAVGAIFVAIGLGIITAIAMRSKPSKSQLSGAGKRFMPRSSPKTLISDLRQSATLLTEQTLKKNKRSAGLDKSLEQAGIEMRPGEYVLTAIGFSCLAFFVGFAIGDFFIAICLAVATAVLMQLRLNRRARKRQDAFSDQLEQTLPLLAGSLRSGFSILQAIDAVARESESPTSEEFGRIIVETRLGRDLDDSLNEVANRVSNDDFHWVVQAIQIHRTVGGDLAEILDRVSETIRSRNSARRQVEALSAEGRLSAIVLFVLPFGTAFFIQLVNPGYLSELFNTTAGIIMLLGGCILLTIGGIWTKKIIRVEY